MAQFEVFKNTTTNTAGQFPYLFEMQSDIFEDSTRAIYIPLVLSEALRKPDKVLNTGFNLDEVKVRLFPLDIAAAPQSVAGTVVGRLKSEGDKIVAAID